jgi:hypothetical protein
VQRPARVARDYQGTGLRSRFVHLRLIIRAWVRTDSRGHSALVLSRSPCSNLRTLRTGLFFGDLPCPIYRTGAGYRRVRPLPAVSPRIASEMAWGYQSHAYAVRGISRRSSRRSEGRRRSRFPMWFTSPRSPHRWRRRGCLFSPGLPLAPSTSAWRDPDHCLARDSAISYQRYQVGARPQVILSHRVCRPIATAETPAAFLFGVRLVAIDGTVEDVPDTPTGQCCCLWSSP